MENTGASGSNNINKAKKTGTKRKIPIDLIENKNAREVCFSKRRKGLFKKALELSVMCGVRVQVLAFSPSGNPYSFISPSSSSSSSTQQADLFLLSSQQEDDLSRQATELKAKLETLKRKNENLKACLKGTADLDKADLTQLLAMKENLQRALGI
ncbi:agamous-like MADS-box protein AGL13 [Carex rostrata]